jgi:hypothetical protein
VIELTTPPRCNGGGTVFCTFLQNVCPGRNLRTRCRLRGGLIAGGTCNRRKFRLFAIKLGKTSGEPESVRARLRQLVPLVSLHSRDEFVSAGSIGREYGACCRTGRNRALAQRTAHQLFFPDRCGLRRARGNVLEHSSKRLISIAYPGRTVRVPRGWSVLEASRSFHLPHASMCGGRARCSTCRVQITAGDDCCPPAGGCG